MTKLPALFISLAALAGVAHAGHISDEDVDDAVRKVAAHRSTDEATIRLLSKFAALAPMVAYSQCPSIDYDVVNANDYALWNLSAYIGQSIDSGPETETTLHVPYVAARHHVTVRFACTPNPNQYGYGGSSTRTISSTGAFEGSRLDGDVVRELIAAKVDAAYDATYERYADDPGSESGSRARAALAVIDDLGDWRQLAALMLDSEDGGRELALFVATKTEYLPRAVALLKKAKAPVQAAFVAGLMSSPDLGQVDSDVLSGLLAGQCGRARAGAQTLWLSAVKGEITSVSARSSVLSQCAPNARELATWLSRIVTPADLAVALDAFDDATFASALPIVAGGPLAGEALAGVAARTGDGTRLRAATDALLFLRADKIEHASVVLALAGSEASGMETQRAEVLEKLLGRIDGAEPATRSAIILELYRALLDGKIPHSDMADAVRARKSWAEAEIAQLLTDEVRKTNTVFDQDKLQAAIAANKIEASAFLVANRELGNCLENATSVKVCARVMKDQLGALAGVVPLLDSFATRARDTLSWRESDQADTYATLRKFGVDMRPTVAELCRQARSAYSYESESLLAGARMVDPSANCVAEVAAWRKARARRHLISMSLRGLGFGGIAFLAGFFVKKRLQKYTTGPSRIVAPEDAPAPSALAARLDGAGLQGAFEAGLVHSERSLAADPRPSAQRAAELLAGLPPELRAKLAESARTAAHGALASGDVRSLLVRTGAAAVYLVVVPGRADEPKTLRKHAPFSEGWLRHASRMLAAVRAGGNTGPLLALVLFLRADASQGTLLCALHDDRGALAPLMLLDERETRAAAETHPHRHHFTLDGAARAASPAPKGAPSPKAA